MDNKKKVDLSAIKFKFTNAEELEKEMTKYFDSTEQKSWTVTGLALALDCDRDTLLNYEKNKQGQHDSDVVPKDVIRLIKKAKLLVEHSYELDLKHRGNSGSIFALKNFNWKDTQDTNLNITAPKPLLDSILDKDGVLKEDKEANISEEQLSVV